MRPDRVALARRWAEVYRGKGYQPLPSDPTHKKPLCRFAEWWESPAPADLFERFETTNVQVMTGRFWRLAVLDLDGAEAVEHVAANWRKLPRTWESYHTGGGRASRHLWFSLPAGLEDAKPRARLWGVWDDDARDGKGDWKHHTAVELLCDRSLVMSPPSIHPKTGNPYGFAPGRSPYDLVRPAELPEWVWRMPAAEPPRPAPAPEPPRSPRPRREGDSDWRHVLDAIPKRHAAESFLGLRFGRRAQQIGGWVSVHDFDREDKHPSARFHLESGRFWRPGMGKNQTLSLFELAVAMGVSRDWAEAMKAMADYYGIH